MASAFSFSLASTGATARSRARRAAPTARADRVWQATPGGGLPGFREFYTSFEERGSGHPDSRFRASPRILDKWTVSKNRLGPSRIQVPRLAPDFGTLNRFQDPEIANSPCRIQITRLALRFGNSRSRSRSFAIERQNTVDSRFRVSTFYFRACTRYLSFIPCVSRLPPVSFYGVRYLDPRGGFG